MGQFKTIKWLAIAFFMAICGYFSWEAFRAWEESPTTTSVSTIPLRTFEFPAITICTQANNKWIGTLDILSQTDKSLAILDVLETLPGSYRAILLDIVETRQSKLLYTNDLSYPKYEKHIASFRQTMVEKGLKNNLAYLDDIVINKGEKTGWLFAIKLIRD